MNKLYFNDSVLQLYSEDFDYLQESLESAVGAGVPCEYTGSNLPGD